MLTDRKLIDRKMTDRKLLTDREPSKKKRVLIDFHDATTLQISLKRI